MNNIFISRPVACLSISALIVILGVISISDLAIEQYPDITPPVVEVSATYNGANSTTVANAVATPIAQNIMGVSDMLSMESTSASDGSMTLQVTFDIGTDPDMNTVFVQNNVAAATSLLPQSVVEQGVVTRKTQTGFLMVYALHSDGRYDEEFVSNYAYINLQNRLLMIDGVGKVSIMGAAEYAMRIWLKPDLLEYYDLTTEQVIEAVSTQSGLYPVGSFGAEPAVEGTEQTYTVTLPAQYNSVEQFENIIVRTSPEGKQLRLGQIADVSLGAQQYGTKSTFDGKPTAVIVIYQEPGSNAVAVAKRVKQTMTEVSDHFVDGLSYTTIVDSTTSILAGIKEIILTLIASLLLVVAIIFLFIQDWRATLIPLIAIPVSIIGSFVAFPLFGLSINVISLLALVLAIGLVVDDAIVVVEAVQVGIEQGKNPFEATVEAMQRVSGAVIATSVVLLAVFIPVSFTAGITGKLIQQFAITISVAIIFSTINALTLTPALCAVLLKQRSAKSSGFFGWFNRGFNAFMGRYVALTSKVVTRTKAVFASVLVIIVGIVALWYLLPKGFLPAEDQGYLMVSVNTPAASSLQVTERALERIDSHILARGDVASSAVVAGFNMLSGTAQTNSGVIFVKLTDYDKRTLTASQISAELTEQLYTLEAGVTAFAFIPPAIPGLGVTSGVTFSLLDSEGRGGEYLAQNLRKLIDTLSRNPLSASVTTQYNNSVPQRLIEVDREQAMMKGVDLGDVYNQLSALLGSHYIDNFTRFGRLYRSYIAAAPQYRASEQSLSSYYVHNDQQQSIPLSSFVSVRDTVGASYISQFNLYNSAAITLTPAKGVSSGQAMDMIKSVASEVLPQNMTTAWSGVSLLESREGKGGAVVYIIAVVFVFFILSILYESFRLPVAIISAVPLAVLGSLVLIGIMHLINAKYVNDVYMQISIVMLIGIAAKNSILVVEYASRLQASGKSAFEATIEAAQLRARPIIMTAFAFILGTMPLLFATGVYSTARNIMGTTLVGGMLAATTVGIVLYPALYYLINKLTQR